MHIIWLYRGQQERFLSLIQRYLRQVCIESESASTELTNFELVLVELRQRFSALAKTIKQDQNTTLGEKQTFTEILEEFQVAATAYDIDRTKLLAKIIDFNKRYSQVEPKTNDLQHILRQTYGPVAESTHGLIKQIDLLYKLGAKVVEASVTLLVGNGSAANERRGIVKFIKQLDEQRKAAVAQLKQPTYFYRQVVWLQDRFPEAKLQAVPGLVRLVDRKAIEAADWSLTPSRYVGVALLEESEDFDFEQTIRDIHVELADLNLEAAELATTIQENFRELGI